MKKQGLLSSFVGFAVLCYSIPFASAAFSDVLQSHPQYKAIIELQRRNIISGYPDGTFKPDQEVKRIEALKIIELGAGITFPENSQSSGTGGFSDVEAKTWYTDFLLKGLELKIIQGYPDGTFRPTQTVNLVESLKMMLQANNIDVSHLIVTENPYVDAFKNQWYTQIVQYAKINDLIDADTRNRIFPQQSVTRGKLADMMYRLILAKEKKEISENSNLPTAQINIDNFAFSPTNLTLSVGSTVQWTNKDSMVHTVTSDNGLFDSENLSPGKSFEFTFNKVGTYSYHCTPHPKMKGTIIIKGADEVPTI